MTQLTQDEFLKREIHTWGEDYIFDLIDRGYELVLTTAGWRWLLPMPVDTGAASCYDRTAGV